MCVRERAVCDVWLAGLNSFQLGKAILWIYEYAYVSNEKFLVECLVAAAERMYSTESATNGIFKFVDLATLEWPSKSGDSLLPSNSFNYFCVLVALITISLNILNLVPNPLITGEWPQIKSTEARPTHAIHNAARGSCAHTTESLTINGRCTQNNNGICNGECAISLLTFRERVMAADWLRPHYTPTKAISHQR